MKFLKNNLMYIIFIMLPIIDILTSFNVRYNIFVISPGIIIRGFILLYSLFHIIKDKNKKKNIYLFSLSVFFIVYMLVRIYLSPKVNIYTELITFFKFWYFPILLIFFNTYPLDKKKLNLSLQISTVIYFLGIFIPLLTSTGFDSYNYEYRGIVGWYYSANELGNLLAINLYLLYLNLTKKNSIIIIMCIFALSFIGTKVSLFSIIIVTISTFLIYKFKDEKKSKKTLYSFLIIILSILIIIFSNTALDILKRFDISKHSIIESELKGIWYVIDNLLSGRFTFLLNTRTDYRHAGILLKLFGIGFSYNSLKSIEIDTFDIFYRYGIIGMIIYFTPFVYYLYSYFKKKLKLNINTLICLGATALAFIIGAICGHIMSAPMVSIYLAISISLLNQKEDA